MLYEFYEEADFTNEPLSKLLREEEEADEADALESMFRSAQHRTRTGEKSDFH